MKRTLTAILIVVNFAASPAIAWNSLGHKVVAEIAWQQLDEPARQSIVDTLRRHPRFDTDFVAKMDDDAANGDKEKQDHWIFQQAATWPDIIRKNKTYDRPDWHYIDIPQYLDPSDRAAFDKRLPVNISTEYPGRTPIDKMNVLQAIQHCRKALSGKAGPDVKAVAYCWLFHLVGDAHQPLHCTALFSVDHFPKGDEGGNQIPLAKGKNLHSLWDNLLGRDSKMSGVAKAAAELSDKERFGNVWELSTKETDPIEWAKESHNVAEAVVYDDAILDAVRKSPIGQKTKMTPVELPVEYYEAAGEQARKRVLAAGLRLGSMLSQNGP
jgi:S1/P1 Nuclease